MKSSFKVDKQDIRQTANAFVEAKHPCSEKNYNQAIAIIEGLLTNQMALKSQNDQLLDASMAFCDEREYFKDIFNNQPVGLYRIRVYPVHTWNNRDWISSGKPPYEVEFASDRFCEILKLTKEQFFKNPFIITEFIHEDDKPNFVIQNETANKKLQHFKWEGRLIVKNQLMWVKFESLPRILPNDEVLWTGILFDITDQMKTEIALKNQRLQLEDVLICANVGTFELNVQNGKMKYNEIWLKNLGYSEHEIKMSQLLFGIKAWRFVTHPDDVKLFEDMLYKHFSGELPIHSVDVRMRHKKGYWVWIRQEGKVKTWTPDGKPLLMYGTQTDITKYKQSEMALQESEEKYRLLFVSNPQPMWIIDIHTHRFLEVNQSAIQHYGYSKEEFYNMTAIDIRPNEFINSYIKDIEEVAKGRNFVGERHHIKKNGEIITVEALANIIYYKGREACHVLIKDITERKRIEAAIYQLNEELEDRVAQRTAELEQMYAELKKTEQKFRNAIDFTSNWEYWMSKDNEIIYMSPSVERITGYSIAEFEASPDLLDQIVLENDLEIWTNHKKEIELCHENCELNGIRFRIKTKDGGLKWIGQVCRTIFIDGNNYGLRVSNRDITDIVNAENELINVTIKVEERERNQFSRELHDGLGPLLSTIKLYFQWLSETDDFEKRKMITEKGNYSIEAAIEAARELSRGLNSQFLTNSGYVMALKDFAACINETKKIKIDFSSNTTNRYSHHLENTLYRITTELIKNTITYANATQIVIDLNFNESKNDLTLRYTDNGIGFDPEIVFNESKGLGLSNIQQRVKVLKGNIRIQSNKGDGMEVVIVFQLDN